MDTLPDPSLFNCERTDDDRRAVHVWKIIRTPPTGNLDQVVVSSAPVEMRIHFFKGRTLPCIKAGCAACEAGNKSRLRVYWLAIQANDARKMISELPLTAAEIVINAASIYGSFRGLKVRTWRTEPRENAPVDARCRGLTAKPSDLPQAEELWPLLCRVWKITKGVAPLVAKPGRSVATGEEQAEAKKGRGDRRRRRNVGLEGVESILPLVTPDELGETG